MLKAVLTYSKKIPVAGQQYSSQSYHLSLESEISEGLSAGQIQQKIHDTFELVKTSVEQELQSGRGQREQSAPAADNRAGNERRDLPQGKASNKQIKYITDLARERNITLNVLTEQVKELYHVDSIYGLSKGDASKLVESLKREQRKAA